MPHVDVVLVRHGDESAELLVVQFEANFLELYSNAEPRSVLVGTGADDDLALASDRQKNISMVELLSLSGDLRRRVSLKQVGFS